MEKIKLDKTVLLAQSFAEAERANLFPANVSIEDRLRQSFDLVCKIYGLNDSAELKIDKTVFKAYKFL